MEWPRWMVLHDLEKRTEVPEPSNFVLTLTRAGGLGVTLGPVPTNPADLARSKRAPWRRGQSAVPPGAIPVPPNRRSRIRAAPLGPAASDTGGAFG